MNVAVVILNWNGIKLLEQFLPSVIEHSKNEAKIYVVDNASTDGSVSFIDSSFPEITIIQNTENGGYAKGYNDGLKNLSEDIFILLNSDVEVTKSWINPIISEFENNSSLAVVQPKILDYNSKDYFEYAGAAGGFIDRYGYPFCRGRLFNSVEKDIGQYNDTASIFWASGACFCIRKDIFIKMEGFDETFFAHQEEIDLCWRIHNEGFDVSYTGASTVYHVGGGTLKASNPKKTFFNFRNSLLCLVKNTRGFTSFKLVLTRLFLDGLSGFYFLFKGQFKHILAIIHAHFSFYFLLRSTFRKRKEIKQQTKYYKTRSIVWRYFINRKRTFKEL